MERIATSIEESKRLLELGINPKTADMCWTNASFKGVNYIDPWRLNSLTVDEVEKALSTPCYFFEWTKGWEVVPAWSLGKLFDIAWELDPNQVLSFQKGEKMDLIAIMVDFIEMLVREVNTKGKEE